MPRPTYLRLVVPDQDCEPPAGPFDCASCGRDMRSPDRGWLACDACSFVDHGPDCTGGDTTKCNCGLWNEMSRRIEGDRSDDEARGIARGWQAVLP